MDSLYSRGGGGGLLSGFLGGGGLMLVDAGLGEMVENGDVGGKGERKIECECERGRTISIAAPP